MTYNTGNPLGSADPRDLYDNAQNLDDAMNGMSPTWVDRFGRSRPSWAGINNYQLIGPYAGGIEITGYNQLVFEAGEFWRISSSVALPYTTSGTWATDQSDFVPIGDAVLRDDLADTSSPSQGAALVGYKGRTVAARLGDIISVKDFGAVGDGVADDTAAFKSCLQYVWDTGRGADIIIPPGIYNITEPILMHPDGSRPWRNITFKGQGHGYASNPSTMLRYRGSPNLDPAHAVGMFDIISGIGINWENICFLNDAEGVEQIIRVRAEDASGNPPSSWKGSFKNCCFQNPNEPAKEPTVAHVYLYNALDYLFEQCWFFGAPRNILLGADPAETTGIAGGVTGRINFNLCYFTGDVLLRRTEITNFVGCVFAELWDNPAPFTLGARLVTGSEAWVDNLGVNVIGCQFEGMFLPSVQTPHAIFARNAQGLNVQGCTFGSGYSRAISATSGATGIVFKGNYLDLGGVNPRGVGLDASFIGSLDVSANPMSSGMVSNGGAMIADARAYQWPHVVNLTLGADYEVNNANTWETALSSAAVSYPAGWYRIRATALVQGGATNSTLGIRVLNSAGQGSSTCTLSSVQNNEVASVVIDELVQLPAGSGVTWYLQVYEAANNTGKVRALAIDLTPGTALRVIYER